VVGNDFVSDPESRRDEVRDYQRNQAQFLIQSLNLKPNHCVLDVGSGFGFIASVVLPLLKNQDRMARARNAARNGK
jgi:cyclopropane fatty-acyl-phospholipid synthase-like methyltransferase